MWPNVGSADLFETRHDLMSNFNQGFESWDENMDIFGWNNTHKLYFTCCIVSVLILFVYQAHMSNLYGYAS